MAGTTAKAGRRPRPKEMTVYHPETGKPEKMAVLNARDAVQHLGYTTGKPIIIDRTKTQAAQEAAIEAAESESEADGADDEEDKEEEDDSFQPQEDADDEPNEEPSAQIGEAQVDQAQASGEPVRVLDESVPDKIDPFVSNKKQIVAYAQKHFAVTLDKRHSLQELQQTLHSLIESLT